MSPNPTQSETRETQERDENEENVTPGDIGAFTGELKTEQVQELLCQALETEIGGVQIYQTAIRCAQNEELKGEWEKYLDETQNHERILRDVFEKIELDPETDTPGRRVVKHNGEALVQAMEMALNEGAGPAAQIVAAECVVLAETKDHFNWQLIGEVAGKCEGELREALEDAYEEVEDQEDEHLYHTKGWARELWFEAFGLPAEFPPREEKRDVTSAIGAARAQKARSRAVARTGTRGRNTRSKGGRNARTATRSSRGKTNPKTKAGAKRTKARAQPRGRNR